MQPTDTKNQYGALGSQENLNKLLSGLGAKTLPTTPNMGTINSDLLKPTNDITLPNVPTPPINTRISSGQITTPPPVQTTETKPQSLEEQVKSYYAKELAGGGAIDTTSIKSEANLQEKKKLSDSLYNQMLSERDRYDNQIIELEKNKGGVFGTGALNSQLNKFTQDFNRSIASKSIAYKIANDDYMGAQQVVNDRIADLKDQRDYTMKVYQLSYDAIQNDLTESEKLALLQKYRLEEMDYQSEIDRAETEGETVITQARGESIADSIINGFTTLDKVDKADQPYVAQALQSRGYVDPAVSTSIIQSKERLANIDNLLEEGTGLAVGSGLKRTTGSVLGFLKSGRTQEAQTLIDNLIANTALEVLPALKGPASDKDIAFIKEAASLLKTNLNPKDFEQNLKNFRLKITDALVNSIAVPFDEKRVLLKQQMLVDKPEYSDEKINEMVDYRLKQLPAYLQPVSFNSAGNASASTIANAIKTVESSGNYNAKGSSGEFGAYQFMPDTWKQWAGEFLGNPNAQPTPQNQDKVANAKITQLISQGYNPEQIALIWNGGTPTRKKGVNKFGVKYDSGAYADKVLSQLT